MTDAMLACLPIHAGPRRTGGVQPPRAELNRSRLFRELIEDFDADAMAQRQGTALAEAGVPQPA
jgi:hypothetical protein